NLSKSFIVTILFSIKLFSQEFDYEKLHFDLVGVTHANGKIVAYGYSGHVLVSTDKGENWTSVKIFEDDKNITKMSFSENNFYGICFEGIIFKTDFDLNVTEQRSESLNYYDFDIGNNLYVVSSNNAVKVFDINLEFIKEIPVESTNVVSQISAFNEHLYLPTNSGKIVDINRNDNDLVSIIDVSSAGNSVSQIIPNDELLILNIDNKSYELELNDNYKIRLLTDTCSQLHSFNNNLYDLRKKANYTKNVAWLELYKFNNGDFKLITMDSIDRYVTPDLNIREYKFFGTNNIIAVGTNKTIYISDSKGENWKLKSLYKQYGKHYWLNDQVGFQINTQGQICKTINGGITWLPQIFTDTLIKLTQVSGSLGSAFYMNEQGKGFYWFATTTMPLKDTTKNFNTLYTDDFGETYISIWDWGFKGKTFINEFASQFQVEVFEINNSLIMPIVPQKGDITKNNRTFVFDIDPEHNNSKSTKIDSISIVAMTKFEDKIYALMWERRNPSKDIPFWFDSTKYWIASSIDEGKNWNFEFECSMNPHLNGFYRNKKDNIILFESTLESVKITSDSGFTPHSFYFIDVKNKQSKLIYQDTIYYNNATNYYEAISTTIMLYNDYVYLKTKKDDIIKCNINDINSPKWESSKLLSNDSLFGLITHYFDSVLYSGSYKYKLRKPTSVKDYQIENERYCFNVPPYPQPAFNKVTLQYYLGQVVDLSKFHVQIYDLYGNEKTNAKELILSQQSNFIIEVVWNTEKIETGIYFVKLSNGTINNFSKVIVVK
ncbi:MAG: T9SS type A sorting domain-containing protein, partial [Candidatus Kapabacteria bacterium]|nr:T9SS type A sorting domain-containing protein [Candidatus Kapabacteria bacterium]